MKLFACLSLWPLMLMGQSPLVPVLEKRVPDFVSPIERNTLTVDLADYFGVAEVLDEVVRHTAAFEVDGEMVTSNLDFLLFKNRAPQTVQNFLNYVDSGAYERMFVHRSVSGFVIQGGGFTVEPLDDGITFGTVTTNEPVVNEFNVSNTLGTIAMAKTELSPDSATSQWFVSTGANSDNLDLQNGGFTVFGRISRETLGNATAVSDSPQFFLGNFGGAFSAVPLVSGTTQATLGVEDFFRMQSVQRVPLPPDQAGTDPALTYRIVEQVGATSITASLDGSLLRVTMVNPNVGDQKLVTVEVEDSVGNTVRDLFVLRSDEVEDYASWAAGFFSDNDTNTGPSDSFQQDGMTNLQYFAHGLDLTNGPAVTLTNELESNRVRLVATRRKGLGNVRFIPERSYDLLTWDCVPAQLSVDASGTVDRVIYAIAQDESNFRNAFYRLRIIQD